ncbi:cytochrome P460 family protein [Aeromonas sp. BIGb0445]|uniref:cytochrome P460 family protein n=1 Tax=Aeromonas sp. BIGb0445 TaxID=2940593 RepID=UPI002169C81E|nr:cytochrome P460 family protein [Aeromonas sp. BIGb0445]MCS3458931.1 hypothetical protein [Aeromonas sp. BIGb0445]
MSRATTRAVSKHMSKPGPGYCLITPLLLILGTNLVMAEDNGYQARGAHFTADGSVELPQGYRGWIHVGSRLSPSHVSILDNKKTPTPEFYNVYVEPYTYSYFKQTGTWPDGAQIVKEFSSTQSGANCDAATGICQRPEGSAFFQQDFMGIGYMVKDKKRFKTLEGNWGYFSSSHKKPPYEKTSPLRSKEQCAGCHIANKSQTVDYVFTNAIIGLR